MRPLAIVGLILFAFLAALFLFTGDAPRPTRPDREPATQATLRPVETDLVHGLPEVTAGAIVGVVTQAGSPVSARVELR